MMILWKRDKKMGRKSQIHIFLLLLNSLNTSNPPLLLCVGENKSLQKSQPMDSSLWSLYTVVTIFFTSEWLDEVSKLAEETNFDPKNWALKKEQTNHW